MRRAAALLLLMHLAGPAAAFDAVVSVDFTAPGRDVNRMLLGSNVQWVDGADGLVGTGTTLVPATLDAVRALNPTALRYPGGSQSDTYHWRDGVGPVRRQNEHFFSRRMQEVVFGTDEFLSFASAIGAKPMLTVNIASGTAEEAAAWVTYVNGPARPQQGLAKPRVEWWELGNEPYLKPDSQPKLAITPADFARRANTFILAMRAADPAIRIGLPLRSDVIGGRPATPYPGYNDVVLRGVTERFDFVAIHDAYAPSTFNERYPDRTLYLATVAAPLQVAEDLAATRAAMQRTLGRVLPMALTEWNALFTIGGVNDDYAASLTGAIYAADLLRVLAQEPDVMAAHFWSLTGNWHFGALSQSGRKRPAYVLLEALGRAFMGKVLPVTVIAPTLSTPAAGYVAARQDVGALTALAMRDGRRVQVIAINKHPDEPARLRVPALHVSGVSMKVLTAASPFDGRDTQAGLGWAAVEATAKADAIEATIPPHAIAILSIERSE